jgi:hypothetical protein
LAAAVLLLGCTGINSATPGGTYVVTVPRTPFYRFGPMQNTGPDAMLELGQRVTLVSREYGYSRFKTAEGVTGYASTNDFQFVPPTPKPVPTPPAGRGGKRKAAQMPVGKLDLQDVPLPEMPSRGEPAEEKPRFRVR